VRCNMVSLSDIVKLLDCSLHVPIRAHREAPDRASNVMKRSQGGSITNWRGSGQGVLQCGTWVRQLPAQGHQRPIWPSPPVRPAPQHRNSDRKFKALGPRSRSDPDRGLPLDLIISQLARLGRRAENRAHPRLPRDPTGARTARCSGKNGNSPKRAKRERHCSRNRSTL
jgi:hypothetical protein